jgi:hypothetical protein
MQSILNSIQTSAANGMLSAMVPVESAGNRTEGSPDGEDHKNLIFRETDAIGHPLSTLSGVVSGTGYLCESQTTAFFPYLQSALDAFVWCNGIPEMFYPASLILGLREIGSWPLQTWGGVYPRTGWTIQAEVERKQRSKSELALEMVRQQKALGLRYAWVGADGGYGKEPAFLRGLEAMGEVFVVDIHKDQQIYLEDPRPIIPESTTTGGRPRSRWQAQTARLRVDQWLKAQEDTEWQRVTLRDSSKGKLQVEIVHRRVWLWDGKEAQAIKTVVLPSAPRPRFPGCLPPTKASSSTIISDSQYSVSR